jgi:hypothetical protein
MLHRPLFTGGADGIYSSIPSSADTTTGSYAHVDLINTPGKLRPFFAEMRKISSNNSVSQHRRESMGRSGRFQTMRTDLNPTDAMSIHQHYERVRRQSTGQLGVSFSSHDRVSANPVSELARTPEDSEETGDFGKNSEPRVGSTAHRVLPPIEPSDPVPRSTLRRSSTYPEKPQGFMALEEGNGAGKKQKSRTVPNGHGVPLTDDSSSSDESLSRHSTLHRRSISDSSPIAKLVHREFKDASENYENQRRRTEKDAVDHEADEPIPPKEDSNNHAAVAALTLKRLNQSMSTRQAEAEEYEPKDDKHKRQETNAASIVEAKEKSDERGTKASGKPLQFEEKIITEAPALKVHRKLLVEESAVAKTRLSKEKEIIEVPRMKEQKKFSETEKPMTMTENSSQSNDTKSSKKGSIPSKTQTVEKDATSTRPKISENDAEPEEDRKSIERPPTAPNCSRCAHCQRQFASDRVERHQNVCAQRPKSASKQKHERIVMDGKSIRLRGTEFEQFQNQGSVRDKKSNAKTRQVVAAPKKSGWRQQHGNAIS